VQHAIARMENAMPHADCRPGSNVASLLVDPGGPDMTARHVADAYLALRKL
jgi:hypothetical protein